MKALCFSRFGDPDVLEYLPVPDPEIGLTDVLLKMEAIGLNYGDVYRRKGNYHLEGKPPFILGYEGAGEVVSVGEDVKDIFIGDKIGFADAPYANAEYVSVPYDNAIPLPDGISTETAASILLQGLTAQYLVNDSYRIKENDTAVVHAAAGGVGLLLIKLLKIKGAGVIGLTSSEDKRDLALGVGADKVFLYSSDWRREILAEYKYKNGIDVAYDSVGTTLQMSFYVVRIGGSVVTFGMAGGEPMKVDPRYLIDTSKTITGGDLWYVLKTRDDRISRAARLFSLVLDRKLNLPPPVRFKLSEGAKAHHYIESRQSTGKILLIPF